MQLACKQISRDGNWTQDSQPSLTRWQALTLASEVSSHKNESRDVLKCATVYFLSRSSKCDGREST